MKFFSMLLPASAALAAVIPSTVEREASPVDLALEEKSASNFCDSFRSQKAGPYTFYHNNWGASAASSGSQCTSFNTLSGNTASWSTSWTWAGGPNSVKSYPNVALENVDRQLSTIKSIKSTWKYSYTGSEITADVAYDLWLAPTQGGTEEYEIMIWLAAYGDAGPISSTGQAIATTKIGSHSWKIFKGTNGAVQVFSFVATSTITSFSGDLNMFFKYLISSQGVPNSMWITSLQGGTEPFTGDSAVMTTTAYSMTVK